MEVVPHPLDPQLERELDSCVLTNGLGFNATVSSTARPRTSTDCSIKLQMIVKLLAIDTQVPPGVCS